MAVHRATTLIDAPMRTVAGVLRDARFVAAALGRCGHVVAAPSRLLSAGDEVRVGVRLLPGVRLPLRTRVLRVAPDGLTSVLVRGALAELEHTVTLTPCAGGTLVVDELRWRSPLGAAGRVADVVAVRALLARLLVARSTELTERISAPAPSPVVVATALVRDGRVLVAQRTRPPVLAGRWELPGGRVEPGESEHEAVVRECREELGTEVVPGTRLGTDLAIDAGVLRVHTARLAAGAPEPRALEHAALRWVGAVEVPAVGWVDADRAVVADLVALLRPR